MPDVDSDAGLLFAAVREAGRLARKFIHHNVRRWRKADGSPVTEADLEVDNFLGTRLRAERPGYGWLSEESVEGDRQSCEQLWIVDPIDGTRAFLAGGDEWCIAAALVERGRPVAAAVYRPMRDDFYSAVAGQGATLNGERLAMRDPGGLARARVIGNSSSLAKLAGAPIEPVAKSSIPMQLRLALVAEGRFDAALSIGNKSDWDLAAGDLLVHEAGGWAGDLDGKTFVYNRAETWQAGLLAAADGCRDAILEVLKRP